MKKNSSSNSVNNLFSNSLSFDSLYGSVFAQLKKKSYRFNIDSAILIKLVSDETDLILDLGCGCGVLGLSLIKKFKSAKALLIDCQEEMLWLSAFSAKIAELEKRTILKKYQIGSPKDFILGNTLSPLKITIVCNPPYFEKRLYKDSLKAPRLEKQIARELIYGPIGDWLKVSANILKNADSAFFLYPYSKLQEFEKYCSEYSLNISELWPLSPSKLKEPDVFIARLKQKREKQSTCHHDPIFRDEADEEIRKLKY